SRGSQLGIFAGALVRNIVFINGNADRWVPVAFNLVGHSQPAVHNAAVKLLVDFLTNRSLGEKERKDIAQKLIPWLTEPDWAAKRVRADFIHSLTGLNMPELAPGLIWILDHDEDPCNRADAAGALTRYRDPRAIPALRRALERGLKKEGIEKIVIA